MTAKRVARAPVAGPVMLAAWTDFVRWAATEKDVLAGFTKATGLDFAAPGSAIEALIDDVTGANEHIASEFLIWVTATLWGDDFIPVDVASEIKARRTDGRLPFAAAPMQRRLPSRRRL